MEIETVIITRNEPLLEFYAWRCMPCNGFFTEWLEKEKKEWSRCPECGKIIYSESYKGSKMLISITEKLGEVYRYFELEKKQNKLFLLSIFGLILSIPLICIVPEFLAGSVGILFTLLFVASLMNKFIVEN